MTQAALTTRLKDWLDGTHDTHGNPFATMADDIMLGSRLLDLANLFTSGSGTGAGMIPVLDSAGLFTGLKVETCLAELRTTLISKAVANVVPTALGVITLTQGAMTVEAAAPDNVDSISGGVLTSYGFLVTGTQPITYRDAAVGGGNISCPRDNSLVTATGDIVTWALTGTTYRLQPFMVQAGLPGGFLGPAVTADLLVLLATDQITNAVLIQAILNGAFQADAPSRALFADLFLPDAKLAQDRGKTGGFWLGQIGGSTDITGGAATRDLNVDIDGAGASNVEITAAGLNTGALIAAALQAAIRAVAAGGYTLAEVHYDPVSLRYYITSGTRGNASSVAITAGTGADVGDDLNLLAADGAKAWAGTDNIDGLHAQIRGLFRADEIEGVTAAPVPAAGTVALTPHATNVLTPAGAGAYDLDNMTGLANGEWAYVSIDGAGNPATIRDNAVGGGVIWTQRAASIVLADVHDIAKVVCDGARYKVEAVVIQAGQATGAASGSGVRELWSMMVMGSWLVDGDGAGTNGAGAAGLVLGDLTLAQLAAGTVQVYNLDDTSYSPVESAPGVNRTVNWQMFPDVPQNGDMIIFNLGAAKDHELAFDLSVLAATTGNAFTWLESQAGDTWGAMPAHTDFTDLTAPNGGLRSFDRNGALLTRADSATWVSGTFGTQTGYQIACIVNDATKIGAVPVLNAAFPTVVSPLYGFRAPKAGSIAGLGFRDGAATLHTATDVIFRLVNYTTGECTAQFTWPQDVRTHAQGALALAVSKNDILGIVIDQEDGTNEITNCAIEVDVNVDVDAHTHLA